MLTTDKILYKRSVDEFNSIPENFAISEAEFYKNAETFAKQYNGSGFTHLGRYAPDQPEERIIAEGLTVHYNQPNYIRLGNDIQDGFGPSDLRLPTVHVNGVHFTLCGIEGYGDGSNIDIPFPAAPDGLDYWNDGPKRYASITEARSGAYPVIDIRKDIVYMEAWCEAIAEKDVVFPFGNVQFRSDWFDNGIHLEANLTPKSYSKFGSWQADDHTLIYNYCSRWSTLSFADKLKYIKNKQNNIFVGTDGKLYQWRFRIRVDKGTDNARFNMNTGRTEQILLEDPHYYTTLFASDATGYKIHSQGQGKNLVPLEIYNIGEEMKNAFMCTINSRSEWTNTNTGRGHEVNSTCQKYYCKSTDSYAIPIALFQRLNSGIHNPFFNPYGVGVGHEAGVNFHPWYSPWLMSRISNQFDCFDNSKYNSILDSDITRIWSIPGISSNYDTYIVSNTGGAGPTPTRYNYCEQVYPTLVQDLRINIRKINYTELLEQETTNLLRNNRVSHRAFTSNDFRIKKLSLLKINDRDIIGDQLIIDQPLITSNLYAEAYGVTASDTIYEVYNKTLNRTMKAFGQNSSLLLATIEAVGFNPTTDEIFGTVNYQKFHQSKLNLNTVEIIGNWQNIINIVPSGAIGEKNQNPWIVKDGNTYVKLNHALEREDVIVLIKDADKSNWAYAPATADKSTNMVKMSPDWNTSFPNRIALIIYVSYASPLHTITARYPTGIRNLLNANYITFNANPRYSINGKSSAFDANIKFNETTTVPNFMKYHGTLPVNKLNQFSSNWLVDDSWDNEAKTKYGIPFSMTDTYTDPFTSTTKTFGSWGVASHTCLFELNGLIYLGVCMNEVKYDGSAWLHSGYFKYPANANVRHSVYGGSNGDRLRIALMQSAFPIGIVDPTDKRVMDFNV